MSLNQLTIAEARDALRKGDATSVEITEACIAAIDGADALNAYCAKTPEIALEQAKAADARIRAGDAPAMCGIPVGVKDLFCTKGVTSQAASNILAGFRPEYESTVTQNLWDAGAVMLGKLGMDEFAMGSTTESSCYGPVVNPWKVDDRKRAPGGSSGGSAAAVSADLCLAATATDTGGSIRQPAAFTGTVGIKPTYGRVSRWGVIAYASSLDQAGPITKSVRDAAIMLGTMASVDAKDSTSADIPVPDFEAALTGDIRGKRIGIPREYRVEGMSDELAKFWDDGAAMLKDAGAEIVDISLPHAKYALPAYYVIAPAEASSNLARYDGVRYGHRAHLAAGDGIVEMYEKTRAEGFGPEVQRRVMIGTYVLSAGFYDAYYNRARKVRALIKRDFEQVFAAGIDAILAPATPTSALELGALNDASPVEMYLNDVFTVTLNLAGLPGVSVPVGLDGKGLPMGLQLIGRPWEEGDLLNQALVLERAAGFTHKPAKWW
ncbi:Asp-tRNA(Asn)/Glu-tRNA(Gln) amidotransferase subunit GatA [Paenirhodobacter populi]|uniref:Glutamyl-tRNA(Gln) amidotransferase subunit A n=1 Tax=Paenirhodobacter populi TaxID=2306993 RepID=A0A443JDY2_9RHOB|nr:Asp-tRNA(Asn)/Glu-tRNA(Gln) amidotransferase subunit GatA [Sinirhodobacter populi]RWR06071.1 Asp-tRNA(Asn)/Glu-tRNA(Gln) amidotransferase subunit GatA [Sinirhodobacter populi]RWR18718.1 Asp-tRNA(Asn)/Glu-tRNA(Gln) amidotransferase subunit GatA [Sinirhodobacter populi]